VALAGWLLARGASNPGVESRESREVHG
jgi:hypothetical protein